jgi:diaminohydroxyphosphoribosylaminopyrimidine deaminase/5-amino-6-(5-phosphoribosylamino)uracil reductase
MRHALELAERGLGKVEPNPMVGAVIADESGTIVGEGWHQSFGGPHAEVHALATAGSAARGSTLFVTLEPCCHFGKTPPCTRAVIAAGVRRVVIAMRDPAPHVDGGGIRELRDAGIEVEVGLLEPEARLLTAPFVTLMTNGRPWFHAKWAMTLDGKIASRTGHSQWISNATSRARVHALRGRMDAILIGIGSVLSDDPLLTARPAGTRVAARVVLDSLARLPLDSQLVRTVSRAPVISIVTPLAPNDRIEALRVVGVEVIIVDADANHRPNAVAVAQALGSRKMTNVLIEGGSQVLGSFFDAGLIDEVHAFIAPKLVGGQFAATAFAGQGSESIPEMSSLDLPTMELIDGDVYVHGRIKRKCE